MAGETRKRRSRVLEYFESRAQEQEQEETEAGGEDSFQDFDAAFGLDGFGKEGEK